MRLAITKQAVVDAYRRYAPIYNLVFGASLEGGRRRMSEMIRRSAPPRILEVGVGTGLTLHQYPRQASIVGVDLSEQMLLRAKRRVGQLGLTHVQLLCADAESLPFADGSFDCVTLPYVLSVTPNPDALLAELRRVCTPGGVIYILNHFENTSGWRVAERLVKPLARWIGFDAGLDFQSTIGRQDWLVRQVSPVNWMGLSRMIVITNQVAPRPLGDGAVIARERAASHVGVLSESQRPS